MPGENSSSESKLEKFDHKDNKLSDKQKFEHWTLRLKTRISKVTGRFASCLFHVPDALNADKCWGLKDLPTWCFNDDDGAVEKSQENINKWYKAQMHLYELILESFQHSDPQVLNDFSVDAVTDRLLAGTFAEGLPAKVQRAAMVVFAPFGTLCYFAIKARYEEGGTANVIHLQSSFDKAAVFPKGQTIKKEAAILWAQKLESAWGQLSPALQECTPEQLAGLQTLVHIYQSNSDPWKQWATQLCLQNRDTPATFKYVLSEFRRHAGLLQVAGGSAPQQSTALSAEEDNKPCATKGCSRRVKGRNKKWCDPCYTTYKAQQSISLAPKAAQAMEAKKAEKRKQQFAKSKDKHNKKQKSAGAAEAHNAEAESEVEEGVSIKAEDMSGSESESVDSGSEDEPSEDNQGSPSAADDTALRDSIQALQEWTQAHLAQERKKPSVSASKTKPGATPSTGCKNADAIMHALELLQAQAAAAEADDDDEFRCDPHVKTRFMRANTAEIEPQQGGGKKKKDFGKGGRQ